MLNIKENIALAPYTVFKIGGPADYFCEVKNTEELKEALNWADEKKAPYFVLGAGSNLLVSDEGFRGLAIKMNLQELKVVPMRDRDGENLISVASGVSMARVVNFTIENGLGGFEWGIGVPGSIGGSVFGNAGCYGSEMKDVVESVSLLSLAHSDFLALNPLSGGSDTHPKSERATASTAQLFQDLAQPDGASRAIPQRRDMRVLEKLVPRSQCDFSYRNSIFKKHPEWIILGATLKLLPTDPKKSRAKVLEYSKKRITEETQASGNKGAQEIGAKCAGCIFKNPRPDLAAGFLIDKAGLKGKSIGGARVSDKHANFIINTGGATARDIKELIGVIKDEVQKKHGIDLETEIRFL
ncbi:MAG: FAD-binding protein [bacterium]|nr:FAD-binding protein [bacterium]